MKEEKMAFLTAFLTTWKKWTNNSWKLATILAIFGTVIWSLLFFLIYTYYICFRNVLIITLLALTTVKNVHLSGFESMKYSTFHFCNAFSNYWQSHTSDLLVRRLWMICNWSDVCITVVSEFVYFGDFFKTLQGCFMHTAFIQTFHCQ